MDENNCHFKYICDVKFPNAPRQMKRAFDNREQMNKWLQAGAFVVLRKVVKIPPIPSSL